MAERGSPLAGVALAGLLVFAGSGPAWGAAFANGSFETGQNVDKQLTAQDANSITPWRVYFGNVDYVSTALWQAAAGVRSIDLNGVAPGGVAQQFDVNPLHDYQISFKLSGNPDGQGNTVGARGNKTLMVFPCSGTFVNLFQMNQGAPTNCDSQGGLFAYDTSVQANTRAAMKYVTESMTFQTKMGQESLFIFSTTANSPYGPVIDDVVITDMGAIPEPAALALLGAGLVGLAASRRLWKQAR